MLKNSKLITSEKAGDRIYKDGAMDARARVELSDDGDIIRRVIVVQPTTTESVDVMHEGRLICRLNISVMKVGSWANVDVITNEGVKMTAKAWVYGERVLNAEVPIEAGLIAINMEGV